MTASARERLESASDPAAPLDDPQRYSHLPALTMIVGARREGAVLHVELFAPRVVLDERPLVLAPDAAGATSERGEAPAPDGRSSTVTLSLN
jgi:hypothetical protein